MKMPMPRNKTKRHHARREPVVDRSCRRLATGQEKPRKQRVQKQRNVPVGAGDEWYEEADWDDAGSSGKDSGKVRQRIESLREERQLQQALRDTFDC